MVEPRKPAEGANPVGVDTHGCNCLLVTRSPGRGPRPYGHQRAHSSGSCPSAERRRQGLWFVNQACSSSFNNTIRLTRRGAVNYKTSRQEDVEFMTVIALTWNCALVIDSGCKER